MKYIYILSQRYSGSTLLSFLLATHPAISTIGERRKFYVKAIRPQAADRNGICSCGAPFSDCPFWSAVKRGVLTQLDEKRLATNLTEFHFSNNKYLNAACQELWYYSLMHRLPFLKKPLDRKIRDFEQFNRMLVQTILDLEGNQVFLDASKDIRHALFLSQVPEFNFFVIWLSRDPRAQVASALKYNSWGVEEATRRWITTMETNRKVLETMGLNYRCLTYEALCLDPRQEIAGLLRFAGLDPDLFSLDFRAQTQHIMGNYSMRLGKDQTIEERREWRDALSASQVELIEAMTSDYKQYYSPAGDL